jgi:Arc/MetJ family transcription regulator
MRTNIVIDDQLMQTALDASGLPTKRAVIEEALRLFVQIHAQAGIRGLKGRVQWEGSLDESRRARKVSER